MKAIINELLEIMAMAEEAENTLKKKFGVMLCNMPRKEVHIYKNIEAVAESLSCKVSTSSRGLENDPYPIVKYFNYKGFRFYELSEKEVSTNAGQSEKDCGIEETDGRAGHTAQGVEAGI